MGISIVEGVIDSLAHPAAANGEASASGSSTPLGDSMTIDPALDALPDKFIACVSRDESVRKLRKLWKDHLGRIEVTNESNAEAVAKADVVLLWSVSHTRLPL